MYLLFSIADSKIVWRQDCTRSDQEFSGCTYCLAILCFPIHAFTVIVYCIYFQELLKTQRINDDKIINLINSTLPSIQSFKKDVDFSQKCQQIQKEVGGTLIDKLKYHYFEPAMFLTKESRILPLCVK